MPHNMAISLLVLLGAVAQASAMGFDCITLLPPGLTANDTQKNNAFRLEVIDENNLPTSSFKAGGKLAVVIKGDFPIDMFVLQARAPLGDVPIGRWHTDSFKQTTFSCRNGVADTVTNAEKVEVQKVKAMWMAPENTDVSEIEFVASVKNADNKFWYDFHSVLVEVEVTATPTPTPAADEEGEEGQSHYDAREYNEGGNNNDDEEEEEEAHEREDESETGESRTGEDPNESERRDEEERQEADERDAEGEVADRRQEGEGHDDDHDLATEEELAVKYAEKQRDMVEAEERTGEKWIGEAAKAAAKAEKEMEMERHSYERMKSQDEMEKERRMEAERRDKEEYEAQMMRDKQESKDENEIDIDDSVVAASGSKVVATVYGAVVAVVTALLL